MIGLLSQGIRLLCGESGIIDGQLKTDLASIALIISHLTFEFTGRPIFLFRIIKIAF